jgi:hypothetical protein
MPPQEVQVFHRQYRARTRGAQDKDQGPGFSRAVLRSSEARPAKWSCSLPPTRRASQAKFGAGHSRLVRPTLRCRAACLWR